MEDRLNALKMEIEWNKTQRRLLDKNLTSLKQQIEEIENQKCSYCSQTRSAHPVGMFKNFDNYSIERDFEEMYYPSDKRHLSNNKWTVHAEFVQICIDFKTP